MGAPVHVQMAILHQESKFIPNAKTPRKYFLGIVPWGRQSSAYGYAQALMELGLIIRNLQEDDLPVAQHS